MTQRYGADGDREVGVAAKGEVAQGPAVGTAAHRLELVDDLHRSHLGRSAQGSGGEERVEGVEGVESWTQSTRDLRDQVHQMAEAFDVGQSLDADGPGHRDASHVVASEVHEHHVLGDLLLVVEHLGLEDRVVGLAGSAGARTGDRPRGDPVPVDAHEHLRRSAHDLAVPGVEEVHVGRRIERAQDAIERERVHVGGTSELLGGDDLEDVAGVDVLPGAPHHVGVALEGEVREAGRESAHVDVGALRGGGGHEAFDAGVARGSGSQERVDEGRQSRGGLVVGLASARLPGHRGEDHRGRGVAEVVADQHAAREGEVHVGPGALLLGTRQALQASDVVVGDNAHGPAEEGRKVRRGVGRVGPQELAQGGERSAGIHPVVHALDDGALARGVQPPESVQSDEGVATGVVAEGGALEETEGPLPGEALVDGHRRVTVELERLGHRHGVEALAQEGLEVGVGERHVLRLVKCVS